MTDVIQQAREWVAAWDDPPTARISHPRPGAIAMMTSNYGLMVARAAHLPPPYTHPFVLVAGDDRVIVRRAPNGQTFPMVYRTVEGARRGAERVAADTVGGIVARVWHRRQDPQPPAWFHDYELVDGERIVVSGGRARAHVAVHALGGWATVCGRLLPSKLEGWGEHPSRATGRATCKRCLEMVARDADG